MNRAAQSTIEYVTLIAVIAAALVAMTVYGKRAIQGRIRAGADQISSEGAYMPGGTEASVVVTRSITEDSESHVDKTDGRRDSITDTRVIIDQNTVRAETVNAAAGGR